jgi:uncharacterized FAD-dependent dehydrogenase
MRYHIQQLILPLEYEDKHILPAIRHTAGCKIEDIVSFRILRRSVDTRHRPKYTLMVEAEIKDSARVNSAPNIKPTTPVLAPVKDNTPKVFTGPRPIVVGCGPAGLMAAYVLAVSGAKPLVLERGACVTDRAVQVRDFWQGGKLDIENNVLYGEGGAGLFSDGKLTARSKDRPRVSLFLKTLVKFGASPDILIDAEPHIGSDALTGIVPRLRQDIIQLGGEFRFNTRVEAVNVKDETLTGVIANGEGLGASSCILATGHSARDVYDFLGNSNITMEPKSFAAGVRVELPQAVIDKTQYGQWAGNPRLGAASFRLTRKQSGDLGACYTFCMCPGGRVISCASSEGMLTTNAMSLSARDTPFGNAAFIVPVEPRHLKPWNGSGIKFQQAMEKQAFESGGGDYSLPASTLADYLNNSTGKLPDNISCPRSRPVNLRDCLPGFISRTLSHSIPRMLGCFKDLDFNQVIVYAAETRSSSPLRIIRGDDGMSPNAKGLYPCGEGSGYAGGIVSSAVDGIRAAENALSNM